MLKTLKTVAYYKEKLEMLKNDEFIQVDNYYDYDEGLNLSLWFSRDGRSACLGYPQPRNSNIHYDPNKKNNIDNLCWTTDEGYSIEEIVDLFNKRVAIANKKYYQRRYYGSEFVT